jgi:hypothetical protein
MDSDLVEHLSKQLRAEKKLRQVAERSAEIELEIQRRKYQYVIDEAQEVCNTMPLPLDMQPGA